MTQVRIQAEERPILKIFCNDFVFNVPNYQRPYSWGTEQALELYDDLLAALAPDKKIEDNDPYFLGSIVLIKEENQPKAEILDGQQRLVTLTILFAVLREWVSEDSKAGITRLLYEQGDIITGTKNEYRLILRERDMNFFREYIQEPGGIKKLLDSESNTRNPCENEAQEKIYQNAKLFWEKIKDRSPEQNQRLAQFIAQRCLLVVVSTSDFSSAYRIFSVLNDRGLDLSITDILKAEIIGKIDVQFQRDYTKKWEDLEDDLTRQGFQELFSHIRMIYRKTKPKNMLEEFRKYVLEELKPEEFIDSVLEPYAGVMTEIRNADAEVSDKIRNTVNRYLFWLNRIDNKDWIPPAMQVLKEKRDDLEYVERFLKYLERLAAGMLIWRANVNERINRYGEILNYLKDSGNLFADDSPLMLKNEERARIKQKLAGDLYLEVPTVRLYVLLRLDEHLSDGKAKYEHNVISVEHVLPQTLSGTWREHFSEDEHQKYLHKLGNLVLLSRNKNSSAGNYGFQEKKDRYFTRNGTSSFALTTQVIGEAEWTPEVVERRQKVLLRHLLDIWEL
jgi:hypothetical protein